MFLKKIGTIMLALTIAANQSMQGRSATVTLSQQLTSLIEKNEAATITELTIRDLYLAPNIQANELLDQSLRLFSNITKLSIIRLPSLTKLDLSQLPNLHQLTLHDLQNLIELNITQTVNLIYFKAQDLDALITLDLSSLIGLTHLEIIGLNNLENINFNNLTDLPYLELHNLPKINNLKIDNLVNLKQLRLGFLNNLETIDLSQLVNLTHLSLTGLNKLENLNLANQINLNQLWIEFLSNLDLINLSKLINLKKLTLTCLDKIQHLDLSNLDNLTTIKLAHLKNLQMNCDNLPITLSPSKLHISDCQYLSNLKQNFSDFITELHARKPEFKYLNLIMNRHALCPNNTTHIPTENRADLAAYLYGQVIATILQKQFYQASNIPEENNPDTQTDPAIPLSNLLHIYGFNNFQNSNLGSLLEIALTKEHLASPNNLNPSWNQTEAAKIAQKAWIDVRNFCQQHNLQQYMPSAQKRVSYWQVQIQQHRHYLKRRQHPTPNIWQRIRSWINL